MAVVWTPEFLYKHIVVVPDTMSFTEMVKAGVKIYNDRLSGTTGHDRATGGVRKGLIKGGNTLVITNTGGFEAMTAAVETNGRHGAKQTDNHIPVPGAIVQAHDKIDSVELGTGGATIHVKIEVHGATKTVDHLQGWKRSGIVYTGAQVDDRDQILRDMLGGGTEVPDKLIRIIDTFCIAN